MKNRKKTLKKVEKFIRKIDNYEEAMIAVKTIMASFKISNKDIIY